MLRLKELFWVINFQAGIKIATYFKQNLAVAKSKLTYMVVNAVQDSIIQSRIQIYAHKATRPRNKFL
jgi:hypothetical protein